MAGYAGRTDQAMETLLFGGLNEKATIVNLKDAEAVQCDNWDPWNDGSLRRRFGYASLSPAVVNSSLSGSSSLGTGPVALWRFTGVAGNEIFTTADRSTGYWVTSNPTATATNGGSGYDMNTWCSLNQVGPWSGSGAPIATDMNGDLFIAQYPYEPVVIRSQYLTSSSTTAGIDTLKNYSKITTPTGLSLIASVAGTTQYQYQVTAVTGRGETTGSVIASTLFGPAALSATANIQLNWSSVTGAQYYRVYRYVAALNAFMLIGQTTSTLTTFTDTGLTASTTTAVPSSNTAYNTPADWETNGYPQGFAVLGRGRNQRLLAWRNNNVWVSSLNNGFDWFALDTFTFQINGGSDNTIRAATTLFDFTVFFSATNAFFYQGSSSTDLALNKIAGVGCVSPNSFVQVADDVFLWSQFGPTTLTRIQAGADIRTDRMSVKVQTSTYNSNRPYWYKIWAWHDIRNQRVFWAYPGTNASTFNDYVLMFNYDIRQQDGSIGAWSRYTNWRVVAAQNSYATTNSANIFNVYAVAGEPSGTSWTFTQLHTGNTDNGRAIGATYLSGYYNRQTFLKGRMPWIDVLTKADDGYTPYSFNVTVNGEMGRANLTQTYALTNTTTAGDVNPWVGTFGNQHRVYTKGDNRMFQIGFSVADSPAPPQIIGWRTDIRVKGAR